MQLSYSHSLLTWHRVRFFLRYWLPLVAWATLIFAISGMPREVIADTSRDFSRSIPLIVKIATNPYLFHIVEYGVLSALIYRLRLKILDDGHTLISLVNPLILSAGFGMLDELHQATVPGRQLSAGDVGLDVLGAVLGLTAAVLFYGLLSIRTPQRPIPNGTGNEIQVL